MKKNVKSLSALLLALMLLLATAVPALAADELIKYGPLNYWENTTGDNSVTMEVKENTTAFFRFTSNKQYNNARFEQVFRDVVPGTYRFITFVANKGVSTELFVNGEKLSIPDTDMLDGYKLYTLDINVPTQRDIHVVARFKGIGVSTVSSPTLGRLGDATPAPVPTENLLTNTGFENGLSGWTADANNVSLDPYTSLTGFSSAALTYPTHTGMENGLSETAAAGAGSYTGSVSIFTEGAMNGLGAMVLLEAKDSEGNVLATAVSPAVSDTKDAWQEISATIAAPAGTAQITMKVGGVYCTGSFWLDDARLAHTA